MLYENIIFLIFPPRATGKNTFFLKIAKRNELKKYNRIAITFGSESRRLIEKSDNLFVKQYDLLYFIKNNDDYEIEKLIALRNKYNLSRLNEVFEHAKILFSKYYVGSKYDDNEKNQLLYSFLSFWVSVLESNSNSIIIDEGIAGLFSPLYKLTKSFNSCVFNLTVSRTDDYFVITHNEYQKWEKLNNTYLNQSSNNFDMSKADDYLKNFRSRKEKPIWFYVEKSKPKINIVKKAIMIFVNFSKNINDRNNFFAPILHKYYLKKIKPSKRIIHNIMVNWDKVNYNCNYIIYPLHVEPEATLNLIGAYYSNQLELIRQISLSLPIDMYLYVKEHSAFIGKRTINFYKELKSIKNVKLINPYTEQHELIKKSKGVVTVSSTMGFEAIVYKKVVFTFGEAFYNKYKHVYYLESVKKLYNYLIEIDKKEKEITETDLKRFIYSYLQQIKRGNLYFYKDINALKEGNIEKVVKGILEEIEELK